MAVQKAFRLSGEGIRGGLTVFGLFIAIGIWRYLATDQFFFIWLFGYIGLAVGVGEVLSRSLARKYKPWGRRITQLMVGLFMIGFLGFLAHENMQLEGFFFYLFAGVFAGASLHYFIAKVVGPVFFGRGWCGWACWTMMIMDLFPWDKPKHGRIRYLGLLRYLHFVAALVLVYVLYYITDYGMEGHSRAELEWLIVGNAVYYLLSILLAIVLKDNRAFCKYICPIPIAMKVLSRFALLKQQIELEKCNDCGLCETHCLMDIRLLDYARQNQRVLSSECVLCSTCVNICPTEAISTTKRFDAGWKEYINMKSSG